MSKVDSINITATVLKLSDYRQPPPKRTRTKSQYDLYPLPFFDRKKRNCWAVTRSGNYSTDIELGESLAKQFLRTNDGTFGWHSLLQSIVMDMILAGPPAERWRDGRPHTDGIVIGFMSVISSAVMAGLATYGPPQGAA